MRSATDMPAPAEPVVRFGAFDVHRRSGELRKSGVRIRIPEQPFRILAALLERPGEVVTREELRTILWPEDTFVDFEHSLNAAVNKLRETLGDSASHPCFIETVPRRGYRFIYPVEGTPAVDGSGVAGACVPAMSARAYGTSDTNPGRASEPTPPPRRWGLVWGLVSLALVGVALGARFFRADGVNFVPTAVPLTSDPGREMHPAISPDGTQVAFVRRDEDPQHAGIWIKLVAPGPPRQLTHSSQDDFPAWSPDGNSLSFARYSPDEKKWTVLLIPPLGGPERQVGELAGMGFSHMAWTPDGKSLLVMRSSAANPNFSLHQLSIQTGEWTQLVEPGSKEWLGDGAPAVSPDGRSVAFARDTAGESTILIYSATGGAPRELARVKGNNHGLAWAPDGRSIVFGLAADGGQTLPPRLWRVPVSGGAALPLWGSGDGGWYPAISARAKTLVYSRVIDDWNIWRYPLGVESPVGKPIVFSSQNETQPQISPDGKRIVFVSGRSGSLQLWRCDADGSNQIQLTTAHRPGSPRWSPDGKFIVFDDASDGQWDIFAVRSEGGSPRQLTFDRGMDARPVWSPDGRWVYFNSDRSGDNQIWRIPAQGGEPEQMTLQGGCCAVISPDGAQVYYGKDYEKNGIWRVAAEGGEEAAVFDSLKGPAWGWWDVTGDGIYFIPASEAAPAEHKQWTLQFYSFASQKVARVTNLAKPPTRSGAFDVSPDGKWFVYAQWDVSGSDLMLVEDFR